MNITIKDVARKANVSIATVSRVLNNRGIVEEETKKRVQEAVRELSYLPNNLGRSDYTISECHKFEYSGKVYVLNVETMRAFRINKALSDEIDGLRIHSNHTAMQLPVDLQKAFDQLGLLISQQRIQDSPEPIPAMESIKHISLNVSQSCNLSCIYCYGVDGEYSQKGLMKTDTAFRAVDWLIEHSMDAKDVVITFFGGEPLLNFRTIKQVVTYAKEKAQQHNKDVHFSITTNGTILSKEVIEYLNENKFSVVISFDGDLEMQNKNRPFKRNNGSYEITGRRVQEFL